MRAGSKRSKKKVAAMENTEHTMGKGNKKALSIRVIKGLRKEAARGAKRGAQKGFAK